ncbi:inositol 2-dehydrogenase [Arsenicicoccus piscis]|uniref:Inositol 2-dehydrogenase n=1 Tax=Arsenicicoccus piscis TaxID=673954 RepID=A0ABQ6HT28_9MICO|nr:inositol 2-dehydrogenase [Arsenicicoccus piscis]MCH8627473.1 inositol 2-dehydrogenase [Arsenicicoccus piscis]GMA21640.1 inositol 2-dehydrogenase [Arsenicicoccus piscis]
MSPAPVRIGLIGCGRIGQVHALSIVATPGAELAGVVDAVPTAAEATAARFGSTVYGTPEELITSDQVDAVIIASPTPTHVDLIDACIDADKPVLCEKPIDLDIERVESLRPKATAASIPIVLGFNRRFDPHFAELHRRVQAGEIGTLEQLSIVSRDPAPAPIEYLASSGGIFRDMTIHDFDMARNFVPDIVSVSACGVAQFSDEIKSIDDYDSVIVTMTSSSGQQVVVTNSRHAAYGYDQRAEAFGSEGLLEVSNVTDTLVRRWGADQVEAREPYQNSFLERYAVAYQLELVAFLHAVRGEPSTSPTFHDGWAALVLADAAARSAKERRVIDVDLSV